MFVFKDAFHIRYYKTLDHVSKNGHLKGNYSE